MGCGVRPKPQAVSLAAKLEAAFQSEPVLVPEGKGIFDVVVNDQLVYSKHQTGRFPDEAQLIAQIASEFAES